MWCTVGTFFRTERRPLGPFLTTVAHVFFSFSRVSTGFLPSGLVPSAAKNAHFFFDIAFDDDT